MLFQLNQSLVSSATAAAVTAVIAAHTTFGLAAGDFFSGAAILREILTEALLHKKRPLILGL